MMTPFQEAAARVYGHATRVESAIQASPARTDAEIASETGLKPGFVRMIRSDKWKSVVKKKFKA
ncbi:hypothetical protein J8F10_14445 [Gemmata sp. G18]|uniref:HTH araC/xylS-type domain-containing protein n=1 Tax=Gemmata palustris TaxID=2822762 RepID=A0ABS5BRW2_9BACT|nr:hypothetical protein [Gemmata palustris]MBP3956477.1 hypothetical protein [Gemmata palustris]